MYKLKGFLPITNARNGKAEKRPEKPNLR